MSRPIKGAGKPSGARTAQVRKTFAAHLDELGLMGAGLLGGAGDVARRQRPRPHCRPGRHRRPRAAEPHRGITVGIATDGINSSDSMNLIEATRLAAYVSPVQDPDWRRWLKPHEVFRMAIEGSTRATGWDGVIGRIAPGTRPTSCSSTSHRYVPLTDVTRQLLLTENGAAIDCV
jgi:5-methylthioadenosine/S-adenosylhomocysteine deaminase